MSKKYGYRYLLPLVISTSSLILAANQLTVSADEVGEPQIEAVVTTEEVEVSNETSVETQGQVTEITDLAQETSQAPVTVLSEEETETSQEVTDAKTASVPTEETEAAKLVSRDTQEQGFVKSGDQWLYYNQDGQKAVGTTQIDGQTYFFDQDGYQSKGKFATAEDGKEYYYDGHTGQRVSNDFVTEDGGATWYYVDAQGQKVTGRQTINGQDLYFDEDGRQVKGHFATEKGKFDFYYYDAQTGQRLTSQFIEIPYEVKLYLGFDLVEVNGSTVKKERYSEPETRHYYYYVDAEGHVVTGTYTAEDGKVYFFDQDGVQVKGDFAIAEDGKEYYYDGDTGERVSNNRFVSVAYDSREATSVFQGSVHYASTGKKYRWYYITETGEKAKGYYVVDGVEYYFDKKTGVQIKGDEKPYTDVDTDKVGALVYAVYLMKVPGYDWYDLYQFDSNGYIISGRYLTRKNFLDFPSVYLETDESGNYSIYGTGNDSRYNSLTESDIIFFEGNYYTVG
ncbi:hypothetical protein [Streptococcus saliviloxodontae]|uniref:Glucan-binding repeat-containing protein n=1 Tax=Streptococcus saliviloxodontae TaxID=1349416 RepID=A0ABS2PMC3_9STRE|nr:hypothetical protein [Streptococcus saliviloxodontae]MBM7636437.1 glucan-binding repeat-containing protein [Streptococcus saliviloxodontae]